MRFCTTSDKQEQGTKPVSTENKPPICLQGGGEVQERAGRGSTLMSRHHLTQLKENSTRLEATGQGQLNKSTLPSGCHLSSVHLSRQDFFKRILWFQAASDICQDSFFPPPPALFVLNLTENQTFPNPHDPVIL